MLELPVAVRDGRLALYGRRDLVLLLPDALRMSPVAPYVTRARAVPTGP